MDIGGAAGEFEAYVREHGLGESITTTDIAPGIFDEETMTKKPFVHKGANFVLADAEQLPFQDGSFERIISNCSVPYVFFLEKDTPQEAENAMRAALSEMARALRHGGEIRLYPVPEGTSRESMRNFRESFNTTLEELSAQHHLTVEARQKGENKIWDDAPPEIYDLVIIKKEPRLEPEQSANDGDLRSSSSA